MLSSGLRIVDILLVEDDSSERHNLRKTLRDQGYNILLANNGVEGYKKYKKFNPQVIITDWLMPKLNGIELTQKIRASDSYQPLIIILSTVDSKSAEIMALNSGADYFITKPLDKKKLWELLRNFKKTHVPNKKKIQNINPLSNLPFCAVGIATSTGGPPTVKYLFRNLGYINDAVFFLTQHGPSWMLQASVDFLQKETELEVILGTDGLTIKPGKIYVAPGDKHMIVGNDLQIHLLDTAPINYVKPSADPMFRSIAEVFGKNSIGVVLTGMGTDGSIGCGYIFAEGGKIIVEDPKTAILHAMPSSVINLKLADIVVPIEKMPVEIIKFINNILHNE